MRERYGPRPRGSWRTPLTSPGPGSSSWVPRGLRQGPVLGPGVFGHPKRRTGWRHLLRLQRRSRKQGELPRRSGVTRAQVFRRGRRSVSDGATSYAPVRASVALLVGAFGDDHGDAPAWSSARRPRLEWALSASSASGRVRGRPGPLRATRRRSRRTGRMGLSPPWPGPATMTSGRPLPSTRVWSLVVVSRADHGRDVVPRGRPQVCRCRWSHRERRCSRWASQPFCANMSWPPAAVSGTGWITSQCSTTLPSTTRKMSTTADPKDRKWWWIATRFSSARTR